MSCFFFPIQINMWFWTTCRFFLALFRFVTLDHSYFHDKFSFKWCCKNSNNYELIPLVKIYSLQEGIFYSLSELWNLYHYLKSLVNPASNMFSGWVVKRFWNDLLTLLQQIKSKHGRGDISCTMTTQLGYVACQNLGQNQIAHHIQQRGNVANRNMCIWVLCFLKQLKPTISQTSWNHWGSVQPSQC